ncbi:MAG: hypothetical protein ABIN61_04880 [candidate division WOR-3 bacterium]
MKNFLIFLFSIFIVVESGCKKAKEPLQETKTIIKEYARGIVKLPDKTKTITELTTIRQALEIYKAEKGEYPQTLSELQINVENLSAYEYDPEKGKVKSKYYPNL